MPRPLDKEVKEMRAAIEAGDAQFLVAAPGEANEPQWVRKGQGREQKKIVVALPNHAFINLLSEGLATPIAGQDMTYAIAVEKDGAVSKVFMLEDMHKQLLEQGGGEQSIQYIPVTAEMLRLTLFALEN